MEHLNTAIKNGYTTMLRSYLLDSNFKVENFEIVIEIPYDIDKEILNLLIESGKVDATIVRSYLLDSNFKVENFEIEIEIPYDIDKEILNLLIESDKVDTNDVFSMSCMNGNTEIVKLLLTDPRVDPGAINNYAINWSSENDHVEVVKLLLNDSRVTSSMSETDRSRFARYVINNLIQ